VRRTNEDQLDLRVVDPNVQAVIERHSRRGEHDLTPIDIGKQPVRCESFGEHSLAATVLRDDRRVRQE
jgi:hypothetical protein